jgi:GTP-binding protein
LPGYGYARVPASAREHWRRLCAAYFERRRSLVGLMLTVDIRRGLSDADRLMLDWVRPSGLAVTVLLTKADKLSRAERRRQSDLAAAALDATPSELIVFSALSRLGLEQARERLSSALALASDPQN